MTSSVNCLQKKESVWSAPFRLPIAISHVRICWSARELRTAPCSFSPFRISPLRRTKAAISPPMPSRGTYHAFLTELSERLLPILREKYPDERFALFGDHSPISELHAAAVSGLGVLGKNRMLITRLYSPLCFLPKSSPLTATIATRRNRGPAWAAADVRRLLLSRTPARGVPVRALSEKRDTDKRGGGCSPLWRIGLGMRPLSGGLPVHGRRAARGDSLHDDPLFSHGHNHPSDLGRSPRHAGRRIFPPSVCLARKGNDPAQSYVV